MIKGRTYAVVAAAAFSLVAAGSLSAQPRGRGDWGGGPGDDDGPGLMRRAARFLELTEDQKARLAEIVEQGQPERERTRELSREAHQRFREALEAEAPDAAQVGQAAIEMHALRAQREASRKSFEAAFESLLTPEQQQKWEMMQASRAAGRGPGHPGRKHSRGPGRR
jgi:Spy/CpxP family protein refolding chaperone